MKEEKDSKKATAVKKTPAKKTTAAKKTSVKKTTTKSFLGIKSGFIWLNP